MTTQTQAISLITQQVRSGSDSTTTPALPPVSRKKQAAVLLSAFAITALTIGYNQCFGVFQEYYFSSDHDVLPASQVSPPIALLAFVGTLCYGLTWAGGIFVNPIISRIEHRTWAPTTPSTIEEPERRNTHVSRFGVESIVPLLCCGCVSLLAI